jgi:hypothetical protein
VLGPAIGHQPDGAGGLLELRNCAACASTVSEQVPLGLVLASGCGCATCKQLRAPTLTGAEFAEIRAQRRREQVRRVYVERNRRGAA